MSLHTVIILMLVVFILAQNTANGGLRRGLEFIVDHWPWRR
jgi:hypothetical protein